MKKTHVIIIVVAVHGLLLWMLCTVRWQNPFTAPHKVTYVYYDILMPKKVVPPAAKVNPDDSNSTTASQMAAPLPFSDKLDGVDASKK